MRTVTQKDFQNLYQSPGYDQTEAMRRTLASLPEKKSPERAPVIRKRRVAFILAAALVLMGIAAVAVNHYSTLVTWGAKVTENDEPDADWQVQETLKRMDDALSSVPADLYGVASMKDTEDKYYIYTKSIETDCSTLDELLQILDAAGYPHPAKLIPEGWTFVSATVSYDYDTEGQYERVSSTSGDGFTLDQYKVDEKHLVPAAYGIKLERGAKQGRINSSLTAWTELSYGFPSEYGLQAKAISVPGMQDALYVTHERGTNMMMYRTLEKPVTLNPTMPYGNGETHPEDMVEFDYEMIECDNLEPEDIIRLFSETP